jgi:metal-responsive CopG/Arc/MetJ family transcriptional regulator
MKYTGEDRPILTASLPDSLVRQVKARAMKERRPVSRIVEDALRSYLSRNGDEKSQSA